MAFRASAVALFRCTAACAARRAPPYDAPTQIILRQLEKDGPQTAHQIWEKVGESGRFASKNIMKHSLDFLRRQHRIKCVPQDPSNHKINFVYVLGEKPKIVREEADSSSSMSETAA